MQHALWNLRDDVAVGNTVAADLPLVDVSYDIQLVLPGTHLMRYHRNDVHTTRQEATCPNKK
jgi:hypothetical protein